MEDKELYKLFKDFDPELPSDRQFIMQLQRNLRAVEMFNEKVAVMRRRNKVALVLALSTGFIFGALSVLLYPYISSFIIRLITFSPEIVRFIGQYVNLVVYSLICLAGAILTLGVYELTLTRIRITQ